MEGRREADSEWLLTITSYLEKGKQFGPDRPGLSQIEDASDQTRLTKMLLALAAKKAKKLGLAPESEKTKELLSEAFQTATEITYSFPLVSRDVDEETARRAFRMTWSGRPGALLEDAQEYGRMDVSRPDLERGVGRYLDSDLKDPRIDRILVHALADMELSAFLTQMAGPRGLPLQSPLREASKSVIWTWFKGRLVGLLITLGICAGLVLMKVNLRSTPDWVVIGGIGLSAGGYVLITIISLITLIVHGPRIAQDRNALRETIKAAIDFYNEFHEPGTISLAHYKRRMEEAKAQGVVWPQSLWALVEDMDYRGIRHF